MRAMRHIFECLSARREGFCFFWFWSFLLLSEIMLWLSFSLEKWIANFYDSGIRVFAMLVQKCQTHSFQMAQFTSNRSTSFFRCCKNCLFQPHRPHNTSSTFVVVNQIAHTLWQIKCDGHAHTVVCQAQISHNQNWVQFHTKIDFIIRILLWSQECSQWYDNDQFLTNFSSSHLQVSLKTNSSHIPLYKLFWYIDGFEKPKHG